MKEFQLIIFDPGHFHAGLIQKEMYDGVSPRVQVYAPVGSDLAAHLQRVARFNERKTNPTSWELEVHAGPNFAERMLRERLGNIVIFSGRNRGKIDHIAASLEAGLHVLADKPWIISASDLPKLEAALEIAERKHLMAYDIMTERYEITSILQRELVNDPNLFGEMLPSTEDEPAVYMESVHYLMKTVAGAPLLRPAWFFDVEQQGEALADVGTHLVDLVQWTLSPERAVDYRRDIRVLAAKRWPTVLTRDQLRRVTGDADIQTESLDYYCNTRVSYMLRGIHVKLDVLWNWEAPAGAGDTHLAVYRGSKCRVEIRQGKEQNFRPELYVIGAGARALADKVAALQAKFPGIGLQDSRITIPDRYRVGHEAHFAQVAGRFFDYLRNPGSLPEWEKSYMLAKYFVTTEGVALSRRS